MREIVLDTETTGLDPLGGDRLVEIGAVEIVNTIPTGRTFHVYVNPERSVPLEAFEVHGLSEDFLRDKARFAAVADDFLEFVADDKLVIHNAAFDIGFLNMELGRAGRQQIPPHQVVDTLQIARRKHPAGPNSLDALCSRYGIDATRRVKHGALLDAQLLAEVYLELQGGRQAGLGLQTVVEVAASVTASSTRLYVAIQRPGGPRPPAADERTLREHAAFVRTLGDQPLWHRYSETGSTGEPG